jgi:hypothetical protein
MAKSQANINRRWSEEISSALLNYEAGLSFGEERERLRRTTSAGNRLAPKCEMANTRGTGTHAVIQGSNSDYLMPHNEFDAIRRPGTTREGAVRSNQRCS